MSKYEKIHELEEELKSINYDILELFELKWKWEHKLKLSGALLQNDNAYEGVGFLIYKI